MLGEGGRADRLGHNTLTAYDMHLRTHILPVLADRRLDAISQRDLVATSLRVAGEPGRGDV